MVAHHLVLIATGSELYTLLDQLVGAVVLQGHIVLRCGRVPVNAHQCRPTGDGVTRDLDGRIGGLVLREIIVDGIGKEVVTFLQRDVLGLLVALVKDDEAALDTELVVILAIDFGLGGNVGDEFARPIAKGFRLPIVDVECGIVGLHIDIINTCSPRLQPDNHHGQQAKH